MSIRLRKIGQSTAEYAVVLALVVGAVVAMQVYVKRGLQGRLKNVVDHTGSGGEVGNAGDTLTFDAAQYEPYYMASDRGSASASTSNDILGVNGETGRSQTQRSVMQSQSNVGWGGQTATAAAKPDKAAAASGMDAQPATPTVTRVDGK
jgi:hypothetical protein